MFNIKFKWLKTAKNWPMNKKATVLAAEFQLDLESMQTIAYGDLLTCLIKPSSIRETSFGHQWRCKLATEFATYLAATDSIGLVSVRDCGQVSVSVLPQQFTPDLYF